MTELRLPRRRRGNGAELLFEFLCKELELSSCDELITFLTEGLASCQFDWGTQLADGANKIECEPLVAQNHVVFQEALANTEKVLDTISRSKASPRRADRRAVIAGAFQVATTDCRPDSFLDLNLWRKNDSTAQNRIGDSSPLFPCALACSLLNGKDTAAVIVSEKYLGRTHLTREMREAIISSGYLRNVTYFTSPIHGTSRTYRFESLAVLFFSRPNTADRSIRLASVDLSASGYLIRPSFETAVQPESLSDYDWSLDFGTAYHLFLGKTYDVELGDSCGLEQIKPITFFTKRAIERTSGSDSASGDYARILSPSSFSPKGSLLSLDSELEKGPSRMCDRKPLLPFGQWVEDGYELRPGDLLIPRIGRSRQVYVVPKTPENEAARAYVVSESFIAVRPNPPEKGPLARMLLGSEFVQKQIEAYKGTRSSLLTFDMVRSLYVLSLGTEQREDLDKLIQRVNDAEAAYQEAMRAYANAREELRNKIESLFGSSTDEDASV